MWNSSFLSGLQDKFRALGRRDRAALSIGAAVLGALVLYQFVFSPLSASCKRLEAAVRSQETELQELQRIAARYEKLTAGRPKGGSEAETFNLFALLERLATKSDLMDRVDYMRPGSVELDSLKKEDWVEVKLTGITVKNLTEYLYSIRSSGKGVYIKRLSARKNGDYLDVVLQPAVARIKK